jgi:hypothetical protein
MSEIFGSEHTIKLRKTHVRESKTQLTFRIPEAMQRTEILVEVNKVTQTSAAEKIKAIVEEESPKILSLLATLEQIAELKIEEVFTQSVLSQKMVESEEFDIRPVQVLDNSLTTNLIEERVEATKIIAVSPGIDSITVTASNFEVGTLKDKAKIKETEDVNDVVPFLTLQLKNSHSVYKVGTTFLNDINKGNKHFGFSSLTKNQNDMHLLVYGSFINFSLKRPVLIVVKDINDPRFDKFRKHFTDGALWKWKTCDWGNLCFIDYKQINEYSEEFNNLDLDFITNEFSAVLWALPDSNIQVELQKASLSILSKISSVTIVACYGKTKTSDLKKSVEYYQCFNIPLKGVLAEEELK